MALFKTVYMEIGLFLGCFSINILNPYLKMKSMKAQRAFPTALSPLHDALKVISVPAALMAPRIVEGVRGRAGI